MTRAGWLSFLLATGIASRLGAAAETPLERVLNGRLASLQHAASRFRPARQDGPAHPTFAELLRPGVVVDRIPVNPLNGSALIRAATWNEADPPATGTAGWNYDERAGKMWPDCRPAPGAVPFDASLAIKGYRSRGVPDPAARWDGSTVLAAARALQELGPSRLPRLDSPRSGALFDRLVAPTNLDGCCDRTRPLRDRLVDAARHMAAASDLLEVYARAFASAQVGDFEPLAIQAQSLRAAALVAELGDEVLGDAPPDESRRRSIERIHADLAALVETNIAMLDDLDTCPSELRRWLVQQMEESVPVIVARLPGESRVRLTGRVRSIEAPDLQQGLGGLAAAMDAALPPGTGELAAAPDAR